jgi:hypothetical protein
LAGETGTPMKVCAALRYFRLFGQLQYQKAGANLYQYPMELPKCQHFHQLWKYFFQMWWSDFHQQVQYKIGRFTQSKQQNFILEKMQELCKILNELSEIQILFPKNVPTEIELLADFVEIDKTNEDEPFQVSDILFYKRRLKAFREKSNFLKEPKTFADFIA